MNRESQENYDLIKEVLTADEIHFEENEQKNVIMFAFQGDDYPTFVSIHINEKLHSFILRAQMPQESVCKEKDIHKMVSAIAHLNYRLNYGAFHFNVRNGEITYETTTIFADSIIHEETIRFMLYYSVAKAEEWNDRFADLASGKMTLAEFNSLT